MQLSTFAPTCFDKWGRTTSKGRIPSPGFSQYGGEQIALKMKKSPPVLGEGSLVRPLLFTPRPIGRGKGEGPLLFYPIVTSTVCLPSAAGTMLPLTG